MISIVFLASGNGGTLKFLNEAIKSNFRGSMEVQYVITDRDCGALEYAKKELLPCRVVKYNKLSGSELYNLLDEISADIIVTNIHKILDEKLVSRFRGKLINIHYSLLPAFKGLIGMKTIEEAVKLRARFIGGTCHYVDDQVDNGEIISQFVCPVKYPSEPFEFYNTVFRATCLLLINSIFIVSNRKVEGEDFQSLSILGRQLFFEPQIKIPNNLLEEDFWSKII